MKGDISSSEDPSPAPPSAVGPPDRGRRRDLLRRAMRAEVILIVVLAIMVAIFTGLNPAFLTQANVVTTLQSTTEVGLLTIGELYVIITAGIDLSVGAILGLAGVVSAIVMSGIGGSGGSRLAVGLLVALGVGIVCGLANGLMIVKVRIAPFVATLAMLGVATGITLVLTGGAEVVGVPALSVKIGNNVYFGFFTVPIVVTLILAVLAGFMLHRSAFGRWTYAIGSNVLAAQQSGISVGRHLIKIYVLSGLLSGIAGFVVLTRLGVGSPLEGTNDELTAITAVVVGGASLFGGRGSMLGAMVGAVMISSILTGLIIAGISPYWQTVVSGCILAAAVALQTLNRRGQERAA